MAAASSSVSAKLSTEPFRQWMCQPPRSSLVMSYPMACRTTGGPATKSWAMSRTMTEKCPSTAFAAPMPTTLPSSMFTTGTVASCSVYMELPRWTGQERAAAPGDPGPARP